VSRQNIFQNFVRFYPAITPETLFLPTASEIAALVDSRFASTKVTVIVGGSSVMRGVGQSTEAVWTGQLQDALGPAYVVVNLAMNGGGASGIGSYMAERLVKIGRPVIYLSDFWAVGLDPRGSQQSYWYQYFEASDEGYLIDDPERDHFLDESPKELAMRAGALLNVLMSFNELWETVEYEIFSSVYSPLIGTGPFLPRRKERDIEIGEVFRRDIPPAQAKLELEALAGFTRRKLDPAYVRYGIGICFPPTLRPHMIITDAGQAPFYRMQLSKADQIAIDENFKEVAETISETGIATEFADQIIDDEDHIDRVHLSETGGKHLAQFLAPYVIGKAKELGYVR